MSSELDKAKSFEFNHDAQIVMEVGVISQLFLEILQRRTGMVADEFWLEQAKEDFDRTIIVTIPFSGHGLGNAVLLEPQFGKVSLCIVFGLELTQPIIIRSFS